MSTRDIAEHYNSTNVRINSVRKRIFRILISGLWFVFPPLVEKLILKLFFSPAPYRINGAQKDLLNQGESFYILSRGNRIKCWKWGKGPVVLFAHGWNGRGIQFHHIIQPIVDAGYTVITYDAPAHGESEGQYSNYFEYTDALRAVYHYLKHKEIHAIVAHSLGAAAAINMVDREDFAGKIILIAPPLKLKELLYKTFDDYGVPKIIYQNLIQDLETNYEYNLHFDNPCQLLKKSVKQIHIIHDKTDRVVPYEHVEQIAQSYSHIHFRATAGYGHRKILNQDMVVKIIEEILKIPEDHIKSIQQAS
jgi:predicted alpha/beta hydrolase family esterase